MSEKWYAICMYSNMEKQIIEAMNTIAIDLSIEVNIFNPHYCTPRPNIPMKAKKKSDVLTLYDGYMYFLIEENDFEEFRKEIRSNVKGILDVFKSPISDEEIDDVYSVALKHKKRIMQKQKKEFVYDENIEVGSKCVVFNGAFSGFEVIIKEINKNRKTCRVSVTVFGRNTDLEIPLQSMRLST